MRIIPAKESERGDIPNSRNESVGSGETDSHLQAKAKKETDRRRFKRFYLA